MTIKKTVLNEATAQEGAARTAEQLSELLSDSFSSDELTAMAKYGTAVHVQAGSALTTEGAVGGEAFILIEGQVEVRRGGELLDTAEVGSIIGEHALITETRRNADVVALTPVQALVYTSREFGALLAACPDLSTKVHGLSDERAS